MTPSEYWLRPHVSPGHQLFLDSMVATALADDSLTLDELLQIEGILPSNSTFSFHGSLSPLVVANNPEAAFNAQRLAYSVLPQGTEVEFVALDYPDWVTRLSYELGFSGSEDPLYSDVPSAARVLEIDSATFQIPLMALSNGDDGKQVRTEIIPRLLVRGVLGADDTASQLLKLGFGLIPKQSVNDKAWLVGLATTKIPRAYTPLHW